LQRTNCVSKRYDPRILTVLTRIVFIFIVGLGWAKDGVSQSSSFEYKLGTGDKVRIIVFEEKDLSGKHEVGGNGYISVPLIGEIKAADLSERGLEKAIKEKLLDGFLKNPRVSVQVLNYRPFYILGEVEKPGSYPYVNGMTIINAVAMGGGFTYRAAEGKIFVTRANDPGQEKVRVNIRDKVLPGDVIRVDERLF
tara:strand:+ start:1546 stop:2130 length:585 start_codon:yes stop_codon:yes gene_type:complete